MKPFPIAVIISFCLAAFAAAQAQTQTLTMQGTILDPAGQPVAGAEVVVVDPDNCADPLLKTQSAADGTFELDFSSHSPGGKKRPFALIATKDETQGGFVNPFGIRAMMTGEIKVQLKPAIRFHGKVVDENDSPVADAVVGIGGGSEIPYQVRSDADGKFEFLGLIPNYGNFWARKEGYAVAFQQLPESAENGPVVLRLSEKRKKAIFRTVDEKGEPLSGVSMTLSFGTIENEPRMDYFVDFTQKTDSDGRVVFDCVPDWIKAPISFPPSSDLGFSSSKYPQFNPDTDSGKEILVEMDAPVSVSGMIRREDGTPLADTPIYFYSHYISEKPSFFDFTNTNSQGQYELFVYPDLVYGNISIIGETGYRLFPTTPDDFVVFPGKPISDYDFVAKKVYKVPLRIQVPPDFTEEMLTTSDSEGRKLMSFRILEGEELPQNPHQQLAKTNSKGESLEYTKSLLGETQFIEFHKDKPFESNVWLPQGRFTLVGDGTIETKIIDVSGENMEVVELVFTKPAHFTNPGTTTNSKTITGKVFRKDGETILPVAGAILEEEAGNTGKAVSDENGNFTLTVSSWNHETAVFARTDDFSMVGFGQSLKKDVPVEIELFPAASLQGRLIHPKTGKPLAGMKIECTGPIIMEIGSSLPELPYAKEVVTDAEGRFAAKGFIPGKMYQLGSDLPPEDKKKPEDTAGVGTFLALGPEEFDAGDITVVDVQSPRQMKDYILGPYRQEEPATARFEKALQQSQESRKPVLVHFVFTVYHEDSFAFMMWVSNVTFGIQGQKYLAGYEYVPVDVANNPQARELMTRLDVNVVVMNAFTIIVCDSAGKKITRRDSANFNAPRFKPDGELLVDFEPMMLLTFLREFGK